ncbi:MAG: DUF4199 domain-containing protein [Lewinellaceae bacterium]|nr:DUF4199 domain-containing protein [Saprospiraceae bacterium]MCB9340871.1 DUF4199 domain-containing protein [Lewinellaceae bacterium]
MQKIVLTFGLISGAILVAISVFIWAAMIGDNGQLNAGAVGEFTGYVTMIVALSMVFFGTRTYRDKHLAGSITFGKAFKVGILITLVASTIYVAAWMIYYHTSEAAQHFPEQYLNHMIEEVKSKGLDQTQQDAKIAQLTQQMEAYKNPIVMMGVTLMEIFPVGLIITLISSFILKRNPSI